jgi:hypothetical protein
MRRAKAQRLLRPAPAPPPDGVSLGAHGQASYPTAGGTSRASARATLARCQAACAGGCWERPRGTHPPFSFSLSSIELAFIGLLSARW